MNKLPDQAKKKFIITMIKIEINERKKLQVYYYNTT